MYIMYNVHTQINVCKIASEKLQCNPGSSAWSPVMTGRGGMKGWDRTERGSRGRGVCRQQLRHLLYRRN